MTSSEGWPYSKDIVSGKPFLFYWLDDQIEIIKHRNNQIPWMESSENWIMVFGFGLWIVADKKKQSGAFAGNGCWVHP